MKKELSQAGKQKLLVYRFGQIGDTIVAVPSLWALRNHFPNAQLTLLSEIPARGNHIPAEAVLPKEGLVDDHLKYRGGVSLKNILSFAVFLVALRKRRFHTMVYLLPNIRTPKLRQRDKNFFRLAGIQKFLGMQGFPENACPRNADGTPAAVPRDADALLARLAADGIQTPKPGYGCMDLLLTGREKSQAHAWWMRNNGPSKAPRGWFAMCPGTKWNSKRWPWERFLEVGRRILAETGLVPVVFGGKEDRELGIRLTETWGAGLCAAGELSVRESAAQLEGAAFYLGNDTGVMHLAAAVGKPCVAVFAAIDWPGRWDPYGPGHKVLRSQVACAGCRLLECPHGNLCLENVTVESVYNACIEILNDSRNGQR